MNGENIVSIELGSGELEIDTGDDRVIIEVIEPDDMISGTEPGERLLAYASDPYHPLFTAAR